MPDSVEVLRHIAPILKTYGFMGEFEKESWPEQVRLGSEKNRFEDLGITINEEPGKQFYKNYRKRRLWLGKEGPAYYALLPHLSFSGDNIRPIWVNEFGRALAAWSTVNAKEVFLIGVDIAEEVTRYRQGDPARVNHDVSKTRYGFDFERPNYLFDNQIHPDYQFEPWADRLGFFLAESFSKLSGFPLVEPLPEGAKGLILMTGDDDQAYLEKYREQLQLIGNLPMTYFLVPQTRHTTKTLEQLPPGVQFGLHPDALDDPAEYGRLCKEQALQIRELSQAPVRAVRNHGYLNQGYLGHLKSWEDNDLVLDLNYPGVDGTALNASFLPMKVRRSNGTWSNHLSLLTTFGDGMIHALGMSPSQAVGRVNRVGRQIEARFPGVMVFNFHPQNIGSTRLLHSAAIRWANRRGWTSMGVETYIDWLLALNDLAIDRKDSNFRVQSSFGVRGMVVRHFEEHGWKRSTIPEWAGETAIQFP